MQIKRIKLLSEFRGLPSGYEIKFQPRQSQIERYIDPICFVGLNGSGKSNLLEVLSEIFYYLETYHNASVSKLNEFKSPFGFEIEYEIPKEAFLNANDPWPELLQLWDENGLKPTIHIKKDVDSLPTIKAYTSTVSISLKNRDKDRNSAILPSRVIAYTSGQNELLSNPFIKIDFQYYKELKSSKGVSVGSIREMNRLFYLDNATSKFITLCAFLFDTAGYDKNDFIDKNTKPSDVGGIELKHVKRELKIEELRSFKLTFKLKKTKSAKEFLPTGLNPALENLILCSTFCNETKTDTNWKLELYFWVNRETQKAFRHYFKRADELFRNLYFLNLLNNELISRKLRTQIGNSKAGTFENLSDELPKFEAEKLIFRIHDIQLIKSNKNIVHYRKLSDGEHQLLQTFGALLLLDTPGTLILLDEPETHFNPEWRSKFVHLADSSLDDSREQEILITTHSPFIVSDCSKENVFKFQRDRKGKIKKPINPDFDTLGASVNLITMKVFDKTETISQTIQNTYTDILKNVKDGKLSKKKAIADISKFGDSIEKNIILNQLSKRK